MKSQQDIRLIPEKEALGDYLDALLDESPVTNEQENIAAETIETEFQKNPKPIADASFGIDKSEQSLPSVADWTQSEFPAILIKLEKLILALPLCTVQKTIKITDDGSIDSMADEGIIGHFIRAEPPVFVLNATKIILGKAIQKSKSQKGKILVISADGQSGILVDEILSEMVLTNSEVKHRKNPTNRLWLLGTLPKHNAALIDIRTLNQAEGQ